MVNGPLPERPPRPWCARRARENRRTKRACLQRERRDKRTARAFAQILGKFYFVDLSENFRRILFNYGEKRSRFANVAFKAAC